MEDGALRRSWRPLQRAVRIDTRPKRSARDLLRERGRAAYLRDNNWKLSYQARRSTSTNPCSHTEATMRIARRLLALSVLLANPARSALQSQAQPSAVTADTSVTVRWNRLVPRLFDENIASRPAAPRAATAAGDSAALRRIAQTPPPFLFRIYTLLGVAQYAAVNAAHNDREVSADAAIASASAAALAEVFKDSAVRASIGRELARDLDRAKTGSRGAERALAGQRLGEDVASRVMAWVPPAPALAGPWNGTIPTGPGMWYSVPGVPPIGIGLTNARPWLL